MLTPRLPVLAAALLLHACATTPSAGSDPGLAEGLARNAAAATASVDQLCALSAKYGAQPDLPAWKPGTRDAAAFLTPLIGYEKPLDQPPGSLTLPDALAQRIKDYGADWLERITDADLEGRDFSWLGQLAAFDTWSLLSVGRLKDREPGDGYSDPVPLYTPLQQWTKLRFARAKRQGDWVAASTEIRHLAQLVRAQGLLLSAMVAVAIVRSDAQARVAAAAAGVDVSDWPIASEEVLSLHRRLAFASMYFAYPGVAPETLRKASACMPDPCAALFEGMLASRSLATPTIGDSTAVARELAGAKGCELAVADRIARMKPVDAVVVRAVMDGEFGTALAAYLDGTKK